MRNVWLVLKNEIFVTMGRPSYWIMTFIFPTAILLLNIGIQVMVTRTIADEIEGPGGLGSVGNSSELQTVGYVDPAGWIARQPDGFPEGLLVEFPGEEQAQAALQAGEIRAYFLIAEDYVDSGDLTLVEPEFRPFGRTRPDLITWLIHYNLTGDVELAEALVEPVAGVSSQRLAPAEENSRPDNFMLAFYVPYAVLFVFFFLIIMSSGFMLQSVSREKENRTVEVLLLSLRPRELLMGKILGLCAVALFQMAVWGGGGLLLLSQGGAFIAALNDVQLPAGFTLWAVLYFLLGYLTYASMMGAVGALAPSAREGGQFTFLILLPLMLPLWFTYPLIEDPHGTLATIFSMFPLTAPTAMLTRLAAAPDVPLWQVLVGLGLLSATAYGFMLLAARFFRADTLLSGQALRWGRLLKELRGVEN